MSPRKPPSGAVTREDVARYAGVSTAVVSYVMNGGPRGIFASSDLQAVGLLRAAHELGLRVPEDLAVIGFDGTKESEFCWPPLTVVAQPIQQMARTTIQLVLDEQRPQGHTPFVGELVVRQSCGCVPEQPTSQ